MSDSNAVTGWNTDLTGKIIQRHYRIEEKIGQGGMSWLYRVTHLILGESMALKLLFPQWAENPLTRVRFVDEAKIQFKLKHPGIVQVTDVIEEGNLIGIIQEWMNGEDLRSYIMRCPHLLTLGEVRTLVEPILSALQFAHDRGVVHRDIKPSNILLSQNEPGIWQPKLGDFGVAKLLDDLGDRTATGTTLGTFKYIAPEQIADSKGVDHRADIYAFGVMLFQMTTGKLPFNGNAQQVMYKHVNELPPDPQDFAPELPEEVAHIILKCMEKKPKNRFESCDVVLEKLRTALPDAKELVFQPALHTGLIDNEDHSVPDKSTPYFHLSDLTPKKRAQLEEKRQLRAAEKAKQQEASKGEKQPAILESALMDILDQSPSKPPQTSEEDEQAARLAREIFKQDIHDDDTGKLIINSVKQVRHPEEKSLDGFKESRDDLLATSGVMSFRAEESLELELEMEPEPDEIPLDESFGKPKTGLIAAVIGVIAILGVGAFFLTSGNKKGPTTDPTSGKQLRRTPPTPPTARTPSRPTPRPAVGPATGSCKDGQERPCYTGPSETKGKGPCKAGVQRCKDGKWLTCEGQILPKKELCNDKDDDSDGKPDERFDKKGTSCSTKKWDCVTRGVWQCNKAQTGLYCKRKSGSAAIRFKLSPSNVTFTLRYRGRLRKIRGRYCINLRRSTRVTLSASGYQLCAFRASARNQRLRLKMRRKSDLEEAPNYCKR
mgnify:FL=1